MEWGLIIADVAFTFFGFGWLLKLKATTIAVYWGVRIAMQLNEYFQARRNYLNIKAKDPRYHERKFYEYRIGQFTSIASSILGLVSALVPYSSVGKSVARAIAYGISNVMSPSLGSISIIISYINSKF